MTYHTLLKKLLVLSLPVLTLHNLQAQEKGSERKVDTISPFKTFKQKNNEPVTLVYFLNAGLMSERIESRRREMSFPVILAAHHSQNGFFIHGDLNILPYGVYALYDYIYQGGKLDKFGSAGNVLSFGTGYMISQNSNDQYRLGPGVGFGMLQNMNGDFSSYIALSMNYQFQSKNSRPVRIQVQYGKGYVSPKKDMTHLSGQYWETSMHLPIAFRKEADEGCLYLQPYMQYIKIPTYRDGHFTRTPSTFNVGIKLGWGFWD